jgi:hypothetical protein
MKSSSDQRRYFHFKKLNPVRRICQLWQAVSIRAALVISLISLVFTFWLAFGQPHQPVHADPVHTSTPIAKVETPLPLPADLPPSGLPTVEQATLGQTNGQTSEQIGLDGEFDLEATALSAEHSYFVDLTEDSLFGNSVTAEHLFTLFPHE